MNIPTPVLPKIILSLMLLLLLLLLVMAHVLVSGMSDAGPYVIN